MNENCEMFVKGRKNKMLPLMYVGVFFACIVLAFLAVNFLKLTGIVLSIPIAFAGAFACLKIKQFYDVEYEYSVMNGVITFSVIRNQSLRKTLAVCEVKDIGSFGKATCQEAFEACNTKIAGGEHRFCCVGTDQESVYYIVARGNDGLSYRIYFAPNEKMLTILEKQSLEVKRWGMKNGGFSI
jgi:hypothetical protein